MFPGRLRELREQAGLTQKQLGQQAGMSERAIAQWERGIREPGWSNIIALAKALGVTCEAFTVEPSTQLPPPRPGRPRKATAEADDQAGAEEKPVKGKGKTTRKRKEK
jgi:transcriptional regulator with XRE-family HTH domain